MLRLIRLAIDQQEPRAIIGIRSLGGKQAVERSALRKLVFLAFRSIVRTLVNVKFEDTQCGAKVIPGAAYRAVADDLMERGFIFDVELLVALQAAGIKILEEPIDWKEVAGSRLQLSRDSMEMIRSLWRIRKRLRAGDYAESRPS